MKLPDIPLFLKVADDFVISFAHFDKIRRELAGLAFSGSEVTFEVAPVSPNGLAQFGKFL